MDTVSPWPVSLSSWERRTCLASIEIRSLPARYNAGLGGPRERAAVSGIKAS
jgi:hypothetical protein